MVEIKELVIRDRGNLSLERKKFRRLYFLAEIAVIPQFKNIGNYPGLVYLGPG